ncbi:MAG: DinB family protein [Vicinamibacterales bacterium]
MKRVLSLTSVFVLVGSAAFAQGGGMMAPQKISLATGLQRSYDGVKRNLTEMAEKMPEANYPFKPTPEQRDFGQIFAHIANSSYGACSAARGVANPNQGKNLEELLKTKAEFVKALADSFAFCDEAFKMLTDANAVEMVKQGQNEVARGSILAGVIGHDDELYGTGAVYMRLKGLVPPSTERAAAMRKPGQ